MKSREKLVASQSNHYSYVPSLNARDGLLYTIAIGDFVYLPGYEQRRDSFDSFLLEVILEGRLTIETEGKVLPAKKDDVVLLDCYKPHAYYSDSGWRALWVHFDGAAARGCYNWISRVNGNVFSTWNVRTVLKSLTEIYEMFDSKKIMVNEPRIALALTQALTAMMENVNEPPSNNNREAIDEVIYYINEHLSEELTVEQLAQMASFSKHYFIRLFRETVGMTPRQYIITSRMDYAKYLLKGTSLPVKDIGYSIGYTSESMFCATFKKSQGVTPSEYREGMPAAAPPKR